MRQLRYLISSVCAVLALVSSQVFAAATIRIVNLDPPGQGLNDPTPVEPVGGNPGTTLGQQRLNVFRFVADVWGSTLDSAAEIRVGASFAPLTCTEMSVTLAGTTRRSTVFLSSPPAGGVIGYWYPTALANRLRGVDSLPADMNHISVTVNINYGTPGCVPSRFFYLGFDNNPGPGGHVLATTLQHELAHGLGFGTTTSVSTGVQAAAAGSGIRYPSIYDYFIFDKTAGLRWDEMTDAQRQASAINFNNVVWDGPQVTAMTRANGSGMFSVRVDSPATIAQRMRMTGATFGPVVSPATSVTGQVAATIPPIACPEITNPEVINGKLALIESAGGGVTGCTFAYKVAQAQAAGAIGVVITRSAPGLITMGGTDPSITIPSVMITQADGAAIRSHLSSGVQMTLDAELDLIDSQDRMTLYTPTTINPGSTIAHWDNQYSPSVLMDPSTDQSLPQSQDLTVRQLADIGWFPTGRVNRSIAFHRIDGSLHRIGQGPLPTSLGQGYWPSYAPHGQRLALSRFSASGRMPIVLINSDGSGEREITSTSGYDFHAAWSPDGNRIAFVRDETGTGESTNLYIVDVDGRNLRRLTDTPNIFDLRPNWSPDSNRIVFSRMTLDRTGARIYVINADGTDEQRITSGFIDVDSDWAPDGSKIVFTSNRLGPSQIFAMNPDGSDITPITATKFEETEPRWSPDSQKITFVSQRRGSPQIFTMNRDGSMPEPLTAGVGSEGSPVWQGLP